MSKLQRVFPCLLLTLPILRRRSSQPPRKQPRKSRPLSSRRARCPVKTARSKPVAASSRPGRTARRAVAARSSSRWWCSRRRARIRSRTRSSSSAAAPARRSPAEAGYAAADQESLRNAGRTVISSSSTSGAPASRTAWAATSAARTPTCRAYLGEMFPVDAVRKCREELEKKYDLTLYTTDLAMDDIEDARAWLGYGKINLRRRLLRHPRGADLPAAASAVGAHGGPRRRGAHGRDPPHLPRRRRPALARPAARLVREGRGLPRQASRRSARSSRRCSTGCPGAGAGRGRAPGDRQAGPVRCRGTSSPTASAGSSTRPRPAPRCRC